MPTTVTQQFNIDHRKFYATGAFDSFLDIDTRFFINPDLLKITRIPDLKNSYNNLRNYFNEIIKLLTYSEKKGDRFWREADKRLVFQELQGICMGYSKKGTGGSGMGYGLRQSLLETAWQIIKVGINDPEIFELVGLFEAGVGCDRISDMIGKIIQDDLLSYTDRIFQELGIRGDGLVVNDKAYNIPCNPFNSKPIILLPRDILDDLPEALSWEDIDYVCFKNEQLRRRINQLVGYQWSEERKKLTKTQLKELLLKNPEILRELLDIHKNKKATPYDFENDPAGEVLWHKVALDYTDKFQLSLYLSKTPTIDDVEDVVNKICNQFKDLVENNGLWEFLYRDKKRWKPYREPTAQKLFYAIADIYCKANNLDLSPSSDGGRGPVDFKISYGYEARIVVEIKLSSNPNLVKGYFNQLPTYQKAEKKARGKYLVIDVGNSERRIKRLYEEKNKASDKYSNLPEIVLVDGTPKKSASKV